MQAKVRFVWRWRLLAVNFLLFPLAEHPGRNTPYYLYLLFAADALLLLLIFCKYKNLHINLNHSKLSITQGIFLHTTLVIPLSHTCAAKSFATPLSRYAGLCNLILYCEGVRFFLPLTDKALADEIIVHTRVKKK